MTRIIDAMTTISTRSTMTAKFRRSNEFLLSERLLPFDNLSNEFSFLLSVRNAIGPEYFVKPNGGLVVRIRMLPGVPWKIGLRFSSYQAPINGGDVIFLRDGQ